MTMRYCPTCGARFSNEAAFCPHDGASTQLLEEVQTGDPLIGRVVDGRYRFEEVIGEGGMGIVYRATHTVLSKPLAVKVLRGDMARDENVVRRFMQEGQAATSIGHENIIDVSDFGRLPDGSVYFVMEFLEGEALTDLIKRGGSLPMSDAIRVVRQIAAALGAAHDRGIVHRDLKPDNVYLIVRGEEPLFVKVLDFGIAKVGGAASKLTRTGMVFGTPHYMSPEQAAGQSVDQRTDVYALGIIMYEMFTGKVPFDADTFMGILSKHMFEPPVPPSEAGDRSLGAIEDVILRALAKKPENRYQDMASLIADLDRVAAGGTVEIGRRAGIAPPENLADSLEPPSRTEMGLGGSGDRLPTSRAGAWLGLGLAVVLVCGAGVGAVLAFGGEEATPADAGRAAAPAQPPVAAADPRPEVPPEEGGEAAPAPAAQTIEIASDPPGAQVVFGGATVGNTPVRLPMPAEGATAEVELRLRGHETQVVRVTPTSGDRITVTLEPERRAQGGGRPRPPREGPGPTEPPPVMREPAGPTMSSQTATMRSIASEVVDPWNM